MATNLLKPLVSDSIEEFEKPLSPDTDGISAAGFYPQYSTSNDQNVGVERTASGRLLLRGSIVTSGSDIRGSDENQRFVFPDSSGTTYLGDVGATGSAHLFKNLTTLTSGNIAEFYNGNPGSLKASIDANGSLRLFTPGYVATGIISGTPDNSSIALGASSSATSVSTRVSSAPISFHINYWDLGAIPLRSWDILAEATTTGGLPVGELIFKGESVEKLRLGKDGRLVLTGSLYLGGSIQTSGGPGTSGQVLTSGGAGFIPSWTTLTASIIPVTPFDDISSTNTQAALEEINLSVTETDSGVVNVQSFGAVGDGVTDDASSINSALEYAANTSTNKRSIVYVPDGTYIINSALLIGSNTTLRLSPNAVIKRGVSTMDAMLLNDSDGSEGLYNMQSDIIVEGGTWDGNAALATACTAIAFGHCTNITIRDLTVTGIYSWHHVEFNAVKNGQILNCIFKDFVVGSRVSEAVQLDLAVNSGAWPWFGPYDNTPCINILIDGCTFTGTQSKAIGSHSSVTGVWHEHIRITNCYIENCVDPAINTYNWRDVVISNNSFENCFACVKLEQVGTQLCENFVISNNVMADSASQDAVNARPIFVQGSSTDQNLMRYGTIANNVIRNAGRHAIGLDYTDNWTIIGNTIEDSGSATAESGYGIAVFNSDHTVISGNMVDNAYVYGIYLATANGCTAAGNVIRNAGTYGIYLTACVSSSVTGNTIRTTGNNGLYVTSSSDSCVVSGNTVYGAANNGILVTGSSKNCSVTGNTVTECGDSGIYIGSSATQNVISNNVITNCSRNANSTFDGILITGATYNNVQGNTVRKDTTALANTHRYGISVSSGAGNFVTNNDLKDSGNTGTLNNPAGATTTAGNKLA